MKILLWDIDGTLIKIDQENKISKHLMAFNKIKKTNISFNFKLYGMTDLEHILYIAQKNKIELSLEEQSKILNYLDEVTSKNLAMSNGLKLETLPGVLEVLTELQEENFYHGILTGNTEKRAIIKLESAGLSNFFNHDYLFFAGEHISRIKYMEQIKDHLSNKRIIIIGDSKNDIKAAKHINLPIVSVCTGGFTLSQLKNLNPNKIIIDFKTDKIKFKNFIKSY